MWKRNEESTGKPTSAVNTANASNEETVRPTAPQSSERRGTEAEPTARTYSIAHIGKSLRIKGELSGSEDLQIDGLVEGTVQLRDHLLTVGGSGKVRANVNARKVVIHGSVEGNIRAVDSVEVHKTGSLMGDLVVAGISIEEGAYFKGSIDIQKAGEAERKSREPGRVQSSQASQASNDQLVPAAANRPQ